MATTVLITGATGLVGNALVPALLQRGYRLILLTRTRQAHTLPYATHAEVRYVYWNPSQAALDAEVLRQADHIVHLAGANVADKRWTAAQKKEIVDSRVQSGRLLVDRLKEITHRPLSFVGASAIGWYGADSEAHSDPFSETDPYDSGFLGDTCRQWEESTEPLTALGIRRVILRIGIVLSRKAGALPEFERPLRFGMAPILGSGKQIISWIQLQDLVSMIIFSIEQSTLQGIYNATAPSPVSQYALMKALARQRNQLFIPVPVPAFLLKWLMGEMSIEVLKSTRVSAVKVQQAGFFFSYPSIEEALPVC
ncbi:MAG: TIGR01777 family oxidoreductase [Sphingomonadales bacterium]